MGSIDSNYGCLLTGDGTGNFRYMPQPLSGLCVKGDVKSAEEITIQQTKHIAVGVSNGELMVYKQLP
jgi:hypothetical protein